MIDDHRKNLTAPSEHRHRFGSSRDNLDGSDTAGHLSGTGAEFQMPGFLGRNQQLVLPLPGTIARFSLPIQQAGKPY